MAAGLDGVRDPGTPVKGLYLGAGAMSLPRYLAATRSGSTAEVLEIDPGVVRIDDHYLGTADLHGVSVRYGDGRTLVRSAPEASYDLVVGDAFGGVAVPWHLTTLEAAADLRDRLAPGGVYVLNLIDSAPDAFARAELATLRQVFPHVVVAADEGTLAGAGGGNHVVVAATSSPADRADRREPPADDAPVAAARRAGHGRVRGRRPGAHRRLRARRPALHAAGRGVRPVRGSA